MGYLFFKELPKAIAEARGKERVTDSDVLIGLGALWLMIGICSVPLLIIDALLR